jgi:hypothetical protein
MTNGVAYFSQRGGAVRLLNVHMENIRHQPNAFATDFPDDACPVFLFGESIGLVAI